MTSVQGRRRRRQQILSAAWFGITSFLIVFVLGGARISSCSRLLIHLFSDGATLRFSLPFFTHTHELPTVACGATLVTSITAKSKRGDVQTSSSAPFSFYRRFMNFHDKLLDQSNLCSSSSTAVFHAVSP